MLSQSDPLKCGAVRGHQPMVLNLLSEARSALSTELNFWSISVTVKQPIYGFVKGIKGVTMAYKTLCHAIVHFLVRFPWRVYFSVWEMIVSV